MIVAGLQFDLAWEDPAVNFRRADRLAEQAAAAGARLLALPEMFATGFAVHSDEVPQHADSVREYLSEMARRHGTWVLGGYAEPGGHKPLNSCSLMSPDGGEALHYSKIHPFSLAGEQRRYAGGDHIHTITIEGVRVTPFICYDLRFPEIFRAAAGDTELFVVIANWPERRSYAWRTLLAARAIDGQAYLLGVNRVGEAEGVSHRGDSALIDPMGEVAEELVGDSGVVIGEVDPDRVHQIRDRFGFLDDRRPQLYSRLFSSDSSS
jgi:predicted amidohydrolase